MQEQQTYLNWYQAIVQFIVEYSMAVFGALVIMAIGVLFARKISTLTVAICQRHQIDITLSNFIASFIRIGLIVMVAIMALSQVGVSVTPLLAAVGAISLGAGLAVQGLVSNYGAGLSIILARTFVIGDTITVSGICGVVTEIHLGYTILLDQDDNTVLVPNRHIVGEVIKNSQQDTLVILNVNIGYDQDAKKAITLIESIVKQQNLVNLERTFYVGIEALGDHAIELCARFWVKSNSHICAEQQTNLAILEAFKANEITFAPPRMMIEHLSLKQTALKQTALEHTPKTPKPTASGENNANIS